MTKDQKTNLSSTVVVHKLQALASLNVLLNSSILRAMNIIVYAVKNRAIIMKNCKEKYCPKPLTIEVPAFVEGKKT